MRRAYIPLSGGKKLYRSGRARSDYFEDRRRSDLLFPPARTIERGRSQHDRQRLLQAGLSRASYGVRRRSPETSRREPGRKRRVKIDRIDRINRTIRDENDPAYPVNPV